jgi:O-antigen/teichoic acid export membrane protein
MSILRAGAVYAAANVASAAVPFLLLPLLTRLLDPSEFGHVVQFAMLVTLCMPFAGLSVHSAIGVEWFGSPRETVPAYVGTALTIGLLTTLLTTAAAALLLALRPELGSGLGPAWGALAALTAGANVLMQCRLVLWQSQQLAVRNAVLQIAASVLNVALSLAFVVWLGWGACGRNLGILASAVAMAAIGVALLLHSGDARVAFEREQAQAIVAYGLPLVPHVLGGVLLGTADRWMVSGLLGPHALGIYGAGAQLGVAMSLLADAFVKAYAPWLYARLASQEAGDRHVVVGAIYAAVPAFLALGLAVGVALHLAGPLLLGARFADGLRVLPWFMLGGAMTGIYMCSSCLFFFARRTGTLAALSLSSAIVGTLATLALVSRFGIDGAAIGYALTQAILAVCVTTAAMRNFDLPWRDVTGSLALWWRRLALRSPGAA